jgi:UPF0755 protein
VTRDGGRRDWPDDEALRRTDPYGRAGQGGARHTAPDPNAVRGRRAKPGVNPLAGAYEPDPDSRPDPYGPPDSYKQPNSPGRPDQYGSPHSYGRPEQYRQPAPSGQPGPSGQPAPPAQPAGYANGSYGAESSRSGEPGYRPGDPHDPTGRYRGPDPYSQPGVPDPYGQPGVPNPYGSRGGPAERNPGTQPGIGSERDPRTQPGIRRERDPYSQPGARDPYSQPGARDPYSQPGVRDPRQPGSQDPLRQQASRASRDSSSQRPGFGAPGDYGQRAGYGQREGYVEGYGQQQGYGRSAEHGSPPGYGQPDDYRNQDGYGRPSHSAGRDGYGQPDDYRKPEDYGHSGGHGQPEDYGEPGRGQRSPASGPFRWLPPGDITGPQSGVTGPQGRVTGPQVLPGALIRPGAQVPGSAVRPGAPVPPGPPAWPGTAAPPGTGPVRYAAAADKPPAAQDDWDQGRDAGYRQGSSGPGTGPGGGAGGPVGRQGWPDGTGWRGGPGGQPVPGRQDDPGNAGSDGPAVEGSLIPGFAGSERGGRDRGGPPRKRRTGRLVAPLLAIVLIGLLGVLGGGGYYLWGKLHSPDYAGPGTGGVTVQVLPGDTATSLAPRLVQLGVVASTSAFISAAKHSKDPVGLEPGTFRLRKHMQAALAYALLLDPKSRLQTTVTIPDGLRLTQILSTLAARTQFSASAYASAAKDTAALGLPAYSRGNLEGYLYPATYAIQPGGTALGVLQAMVRRFNQEAASINLVATSAQKQVTADQVIIVASLLEAEGGSLGYYAKIARVIYNRLDANWYLGLDSTVLYALHKFGFLLTNAQLHVNSPYNTFIHHGLPPGPIDSPGQAAIEAALHPAPGNWMYFVTVNPKTGLTKFTNSKTVFDQYEAECQAAGAC